MTSTPRLLAFSGSTRTDSHNKKLLRVAISIAQNAGADVTMVELRDLALPLYDGDLEEREGLPAGARTLKDLMLPAHGFLIASPEYNSGTSAVLKNAIDWASRPAPTEAPLGCFARKVAGLMSASPGDLGGLRGLFTLRSVLGNIQMLVLPDQVALPRSHDAFLDDGKLKDEKIHKRLEALVARVVEVTRRLND